MIIDRIILVEYGGRFVVLYINFREEYGIWVFSSVLIMNVVYGYYRDR